MTEEEEQQQQQEDENKRIRPRERARGQKRVCNNFVGGISFTIDLLLNRNF